MSLHVPPCCPSPVCDGHSHCNPLQGWEPQLSYEPVIWLCDMSRSCFLTSHSLRRLPQVRVRHVPSFNDIATLATPELEDLMAREIARFKC